MNLSRNKQHRAAPGHHHPFCHAKTASQGDPGYRTTRKERKQSSQGDCQRHRKCNNGSRGKISHGRPPSKFRSSFSSTRIVKRTSPSPTPPSLEIPIAPQSHPSIHPRPKKNISPKKNRSKPGVVVTSREDPSRSHSPIPTPPQPPHPAKPSYTPRPAAAPRPRFPHIALVVVVRLCVEESLKKEGYQGGITV